VGAITADIPPGEPPVLLSRHFQVRGGCYLDVDPESHTRSPHSVKVPSGAFQEIVDAWAGELAYGPGLIRAPLAIICGGRDSMCTDADTCWLFEALKTSPIRRDIKISRATHLMHLQGSHYAFYLDIEAFVAAGDGVA